MNFRVMSTILEVLYKARLSRCEHRGYFFLRVVFVEGTRYSFSGLYGYVKIFIPRFHAPGRSFTICLFHRSQWNFQWLLHNVAQFLLVRITIMVPHMLTSIITVFASRRLSPSSSSVRATETAIFVSFSCISSFFSLLTRQTSRSHVSWKERAINVDTLFLANLRFLPNPTRLNSLYST